MSYEYRTPGTALWWASVAEWVACAQRIDQRRCSEARSRALVAHAAALPRDVIDAETRIDAIDAALDLLKYGPPGLARPPRGNRDGHPTTRIIMELSNRHAALRREADAATISGGDNWRAMHPSAKT